MVNLLKNIADSRAPLRPPGAVDEKDFEKLCIRCRKCELVCPYKSIKTAHAEWGVKMGTPIIVPREIPCYLCMKCPEVCPSGALQVVDKKKVAMGKAVIDTSLCLPYNGIICRACFERCPIYREAITLKDEMYPEVHPDKCVGCGICEQVCLLTDQPAITVISRHL